MTEVVLGEDMAKLVSSIKNEIPGMAIPPEVPKIEEPAVATETQETQATEEVVEETVEEAAPPKEEPVQEEKELVSPKILDIARRENKLRKERKQLEDERKQLQAEKNKKFNDPIEALTAAGYTVEDAVSRVLGLKSQTVSGTATVSPEQTEYVQKVQELDSRLKQVEAKEQQASVAEYKSGLTKHIQSKPEYELINETGDYDTVLGYIEAYYEKEGEVPTWDEAAAAIEEALETQLLPKAKKITNTNKFKKFITANSGTPEQKKVAITSGKTLSNKNSTVSGIVKAEDLTEEERIARAIAVLK